MRAESGRRAGLRVPLAYLIDQIAQRYGMTPMAVEEMPYAWRETALTFLQLEGEAQMVRNRQQDTEPSSSAEDAPVRESFAALRERRLAEKRLQDAEENGRW